MSSVPVDIGRDEARRAAVDELSKGKYEDEALIERVWRWLGELLTRLLSDAVGAGVDGLVAVVVLAVVLVGLTAVLVWSLRRMSRSARARTGAVFGRQGRTAAEHRAAAERFAALGQWPAAIQERLRAIARTLQERDIVTDLPARTADELATAAGDALPMLSDRLSEAARMFDAVTYGEDPGSMQSYAVLAELDQAIRVAEPTVSLR